MPSSLVLVVQTVARSASFAVMVALDMAGPDGSVILPVIAALDSCAETASVKASSSNRTAANRFISNLLALGARKHVQARRPALQRPQERAYGAYGRQFSLWDRMSQRLNSS